MNLLILLLLIASAGCAQNGGRENNIAASSRVVDVTATQLLREPSKYSGKTVRVTGYWVRGWEWSNFSDSADDRSSEIWLNAFLPPPGSPLEAQLQKAYSAAGMEWPRNNIRVLITCEALFEHREFKFDESKVRFDPNYGGFGHMAHYHSRLSISKVISVKIMPDLEYAGPRN